MNKMTKGAIATGVGVALLLGGGGTLAVWNQDATVDAGEVVAGDLNLVAEGAGSWVNAKGDTVTPGVGGYRVVPGDTLIYEQDLDLTLVGDLMKANLTVAGVGTNGFTPENVDVVVNVKQGEDVLASNQNVSEPLELTEAHNGKQTTASVTFAFKERTTGRDSVGAVYDFDDVGFVLKQIKPDDSNGL